MDTLISKIIFRLNTLSLRHVGFGLAAFYALFYLFNLADSPPILYDEPLYADTANSFAKTGTFKNTLGGFSGQQLILFPMILGGVFKLTGTSLFWGRFLSFTLGFLSLLLFLKCLKKFKLSASLHTLFGIGFIVSNTCLVSFRIIRPESLVLFLILSLITVLLHLNKKSNWFYSSVGFISGALTLTHVIGFLAALGVVVFIFLESIKQKKFKTIGYFFLGGLPFLCLFYGNLIYQYGSIVAFLDFLHESEKFSSSDGYLGLFLSNFTVPFIEGYVMGAKRLYIVSIECFCMLLAFKLKHPLSKYLGSMTLSLSFFGFFLINAFLRPYFIFIPILTLLILCCWLKETKKKTLVKIILIFYILNQALGSSYFLMKHRNNTISSLFKNNHIFESNQYPIISYNEFWFLSPDSKWFYRDIPSKEMLLSTYGGYYVILSPFKLKAVSSTVQNKAIYKHDLFHQTFEKFKAYAEPGTLLLETTVHPWGKIKVIEVKSSSVENL
jgi:hypothetical protein